MEKFFINPWHMVGVRHNVIHAHQKDERSIRRATPRLPSSTWSKPHKICFSECPFFTTCVSSSISSTAPRLLSNVDL
jgi:hypothetical protein